MIWQIHHQYKDHTEICSQREINSDEEMRAFIEDSKKSHPLPEGAQYISCNEKSEFFVWTGGGE